MTFKGAFGAFEPPCNCCGQDHSVDDCPYVKKRKVIVPQVEKRMGFNSTVLVRNDALGCIEKDPEFGKKIADAIHRLSHERKGIDIGSGFNVNAATVVETHHASGTALVAVGGNHATVVTSVGDVPHHEEEGQIKILQALAEQLGYRLVKKTKAKT